MWTSTITVFQHSGDKAVTKLFGIPSVNFLTKVQLVIIPSSHLRFHKYMTAPQILQKTYPTEITLLKAQYITINLDVPKHTNNRQVSIRYLFQPQTYYTVYLCIYILWQPITWFDSQLVHKYLLLWFLSSLVHHTTLTL